MTRSLSITKPVLFAWAIFIAFVSVSYFRFATDYVGNDNDDVMRLVQVRDWLSGQGWFDLHQYRLGLEGGTLMHWSRLIDAPIAAIILIASNFAPQEQAEAIALFIWPILTALAVIIAFALSLRALCGRPGVAIGAIASLIFMMGVRKFSPGSIDHHNVQIALVALIIAAILSTEYNWRGYIGAGILAAIAIAIGAETTPLIAVICGLIAFNWALTGGKELRRPTRLFALSLAISLTAIFFLTTPPSRYDYVVCDTLSIGYYFIAVSGAIGLFLAAAIFSYHRRSIRFLSLLVIGAIVGTVTIMVAPHCLQSPLADLDPLLIEMWLNYVSEAQPAWEQLAKKPWTSLGYYMVPLLGFIVCIYRIKNGDRKDQHLNLLILIIASTAISVVQLRGSVFSNLFAMLPLAAFVAELRAKSNAAPKNKKLVFAFVLMALVSMPVVWTVAGFGLSQLSNKVVGTDKAQTRSGKQKACKNREALSALNSEPDGVVLAPSNMGASILRFTNHRALSAPYHRNQGGMITEIKSAISEPETAHKLLKGAGVTLIAFCQLDPQARLAIREAPEGLYAALSSGDIPHFLELVSQDSSSNNSPVEIYRVK